ncbi:hypothetical protein CC80DRAFT_504984 [Byssothecium circinans]|uniref:Uncharacterized protein n=1 Tax=Byssothecium circinans TaxID=147558 RepID=A0A6A5TWK0_9PLEO|nr:hypothetical protein CC80DRAFT_504984 [Byssothecium circinans]
MSRLDELRLQRELKEVLLDQVRAIYGPRNPQNFGFDIVTHRQCLRNSNREVIIVRAIVYLEPKNAKWKLLKEAGSPCHGIVAAYQEFSKDLEREMATVCGEFEQGRVKMDRRG